MKVCGCINLLVAPMSILFRSVLFVGGGGGAKTESGILALVHFVRQVVVMFRLS